MSNHTTRRETLAIAGGLVLGGGALAVTPRRSSADPTEESFTILEGTDRETTGYVKTAEADGPTVLVVGGMHGNEVAGYEAAARVRDLEIERGRLVTVPRANVLAVENGTRTGPDGVDLNRQFPTCSEPTTELARALWDVVTRFEPALVVDLHESIGLYEDDDTDGVGQVVFHSPDAAAEADAREAADHLNEEYVSDPTYEFGVAPFSPEDEEGNGLFTHKAARETEATAFLAETLSTDHELETRVEWHTEIVRSLAAEELFADAGNEPPTAVIETDPADADERILEEGATVELDASASGDPDGEVTSYEWDVGGTGEFTEDGERIEVTLSVCGELPVILRVTDDAGASATERVVFSTV